MFKTRVITSLKQAIYVLHPTVVYESKFLKLFKINTNDMIMHFIKKEKSEVK